jgi:AcrR family transcriptional regulator
MYPQVHSGRVTTRKGAATRQRIVEAAAAEIRERGTNVTTLDDVGRRSGTGKSQMFHYFPGGREQLLLAVAELEAERVFDDQEPYLSELTSRTAWEAWRDLIVERYRDQGLYCPLGVLITEVGRYSPAAQAVTAQLVRRWQECLRAGIEATQAVGEANPALDARPHGRGCDRRCPRRCHRPALHRLRGPPGGRAEPLPRPPVVVDA